MILRVAMPLNIPKNNSQGIIFVIISCQRVCNVVRERKNIDNFSGLSREWVGVKFVYVLPFSWGKGKYINKVPRKSQENAMGQSRDNPGTIPWNLCKFMSSLVYCVFFSGPRLLAFRKAPGTFKLLRHIMRALLSVRPKCSHRCVSLKDYAGRGANTGRFGNFGVFPVFYRVFRAHKQRTSRWSPLECWRGQKTIWQLFPFQECPKL